MNTRYDDDAAFCTVSLVPVAVADTSVGWKDACRRSLSVRTLRRGGFLWSEHVVMISVGLGPALQAIAEVKGANCLSS